MFDWQNPTQATERTLFGDYGLTVEAMLALRDSERVPGSHNHPNGVADAYLHYDR
jgi:hypothetical protein